LYLPRNEWMAVTSPAANAVRGAPNTSVVTPCNDAFDRGSRFVAMRYVDYRVCMNVCVYM
jgi:hypothetical protein